MRAGAQRRPVGEAGLADLARFRANQRCRCRNGTQRLALEHAARAAVEHVLPVDADEQRRQRLERSRRRGSGGRRRRGGHLHRRRAAA